MGNIISLQTAQKNTIHQYKTGTYFDHKKEIKNVIAYKMPKIKLSNIVSFEEFEKDHTIQELENDPAFGILLYHFNKFYGTDLDIQRVIELRYNFKKFRNFVEQLEIQKKLEIEPESGFNFVDRLDYLNDKGNEGTRGLGYYYDLLFEKTYLDQGIKISKNDIKVKESLRTFKIAYEKMLKALEDEERERSNGFKKETCFEHLTGTMEILMNELPSPSIDKAVMALLHDAQEDLGITGQEIMVDFGTNIAKGVNALSKKDRYTFLDEDEQKILKNHITPIIESLKGEKRDIMEKRFGINQKQTPMFDLLRSSKTKREILKEVEKKILEVLKVTEKTKSIGASALIKFAQRERKQTYFGSLESLSDDIFAVKCADRIHNLRTLEGLPAVKIIRKIKETEEYFLDIAKDRLPEAYVLMKKEIDYLKNHPKYKEQLSNKLSYH